ncbi:MAG: dihydroneopterin aldolase [Rhodospirillaceae bacterium]
MSVPVSDLAASDPVEQRLLDRWPEVRKIFFRNLHVDMHMGVHAHEKGRTQPVRINIVLYMNAAIVPRQDSIAEVFNYDRVHAGVQELIAGRHINLQETLVGEIATMCLGFEEVLAVRVSTEKTDIYPDVEGVGYELVRVRPD